MLGTGRTTPFVNIAATIAIAAAFAITAGGGTPLAGEGEPYAYDTVTVHGDGTAGPYDLGMRFVGGTLTALASDSTVVSIESWDDASGTVLFGRAVAEGDSVAVRFAVPPEWIRDEYGRSDTDKPLGIRLPRAYRSEGERTPKTFPGLTFGGSKTFDINMGSERQAALNQSLRLNISGRLTDDITLNAVISDQSVPITPEGDTRELNELDRVLIELRGRHFSIDMGDTDLSNATGRWLSYSRRLSGFRGVISGGGMEAFASGAVSEGRHMSITILPIEGNQGPYRLSADDGRSDIAIVPGTEKVWLNGERLTRGIHDDYTIDYATGEILFTENRIVGSDMRIVCDYEYTSESYRRTFYSAGANGSFGDGRLKIGIVAAREADDDNRPVLAGLDDAMRDGLKKAGDSPAAFSGLRPATTDSTGTYDLVDGRLIHNPGKGGEYNVTFSWVGEDKGAYRYRGGGIYEFVPEADRVPGAGASYEPVVIVQGPVSHSVAGMKMSFSPVEYVTIEGEAAGSSVDMNTLSSIDDGDNNGGAYDVGMSLTPSLTPAAPVKLVLTGSHRTRAERFSPLDRDRSAEENRRWGFPLVMEQACETVTEYSGGATVDSGRFTGSGFDVNGGRFELGPSALSTRTGVRGTLAVVERGSLDVAAGRIVREDVPGLPDETIDRLDGRSSAKIAGFAPSILLETERRTGRGEYGHGVSYGEVRTGLATPSVHGFTGNAEWLYRSERTKRASWADSSIVRGGSLEIASQSIGAGTFRARYARRERLGSGRDSTTDQALLEGSYRPGGGMSLDLSYRAGRSRETTKRKNYIFTGGGTGSYRWEDLNGDGVRDPDEFIPDEHGSYYLYEETLDEYRPVNGVGLFGRFGLRLPSWLTGPVSGVATDTSFEINERSTAPSSDVFLLRLSQFRKKGITTTGDARFQEDITLPVGEDGTLRLRFFRFASYEAEYVTGAEHRREGEESIRLRVPLGEEWDAEATVKHARFGREMEERSSGDFRVGSWSADVETSWYPQSSVKTGIVLSGGSDTDDIGGAKARYYSLKPVAAYYFSGKGRVEASYARTDVSVDSPSASGRIPYTMARGRMEGTNHDIEVTCDYRLSHRMNIVASYTGRRFADREFEHFARTQLRAMF